ncbi:alpha/beta hydrolase [Phytoactinopolyspora halotolerans]|uniref:Phospholipase n=1 Tax=Phytoactinopolyspora halotolerans TaxID=1981512 RepID=A0A6L9SHU7_9ACTN|nr:phospholipase [Phytoactinopolyspora halotolerans]NEE04012.1 phospholipase [Phytoactinopolyspora halotolerans]
MTNEHLTQPLILTGASLDEAEVAAVVVHGRGQDPQFMIAAVVDRLNVGHVACVLPRAAENSWYPARFIEPLEVNEPHLGHALQACDSAVRTVVEHDIKPEKTVLIGFSQGACLLAEYVVRNPRRYGGVALLTGGYIGPPGPPRRPTGSLGGTPVFLGSSRYDAWVPLARVQETADLLTAMDADVDLRVYDDRQHFVNEDAIRRTRDLLTAVS